MSNGQISYGEVVQALGTLIRAEVKRAVEERLAEKPSEVIPEHVRYAVRTSDPARAQISILQRGLVLTALYEKFFGEQNMGNTRTIADVVKQLFPKTYKFAWKVEQWSMGPSIGQILRWLRKLPEVKHTTLPNPETGAIDHFYWIASE